MDYTTNKNLAKPTENEIYDLATVNENMDKIDAALKTNDDAISQLTENMDNKNFLKDSEQSIAGQFSSSRVSHIGWDDASGRLVIKIDGVQVRYVTVSKS